MKFSAVVPFKTSSNMKENFLLLNNKPLFLYIFETLLATPMIDEVVCYCENELVRDFLPKNVRFLKREKYLDRESIKPYDILKDLSTKLETQYFVLCAITSPFIKSLSIVKGIEAILEGKFDCAFSVQKLKRYAWFLDEPINYSLAEKTATKNLTPLYIETKGFYIFERELALQYGRDIGFNPCKIEVSDIEAINIKEENDLELAQIVSRFINTQTHTPYFLLSKLCKHIILDMDGVLIDSEYLMSRAWENSGGSEFAPFSEYKKLVGLPFDDICLKLGVPCLKIKSLKKSYFNFSQQHVNEVKLFPNVKETLEFFVQKGVKISIVTSKNYEAAQNILEYFALKADLLVAPNLKLYEGRNKPFGDPLLYACFKNGVKPEESVYVGDMLSDYQAAKEAQIDFILASYGYGGLEISANKIKDFSQLKLMFL